ncbi:MAG TPA: hypothetical protein EYM79_11750 [Planctomycetes bacterium]|nr:hypothetical protein [Planctomycetaceae bacterium]HIN54977.1 hypothetical protein [Planctomycetota bacterium]
MWLFTQYGFFSAVCARAGDGSQGNVVDEGRVMVRARLRGHLESLKSRFPEDLGGVEIIETSETDYRYRLFADKAVWVRVLQLLGEELDYDNFKSKVAANHDAVGGEYDRSLHDVWDTMLRLQR